MRFKIIPALIVAAAGIIASPAGVANAEIPTGVFDTLIAQPDDGYDRPTELNGQNFSCVDPNGKASAFDRKFYEEKIDYITGQQIAWVRNNEQTGSITPWAPVDPAVQNCSFSTTVTESNLATEFNVSNETYGEGKMNSTCDMERTTSVSFDYKMTIPTTPPTGSAGLMPITSASSWIAKISGFRNCTWSLSFNNGADVISGTIEQVFATPDTIQGVSYNCREGMQKVLCVQYSFASNVIVTGAAGTFSDAQGTGTQNDTRTLSGLLINMPFETSGANAVAIASTRIAAKPVLRLVVAPKIGAIKVGAQKSVISLKLKKAKKPAVRVTGPQNVDGVATLGNGPDGKPTKMKLSSAPRSSCGVYGKLGKKTVTLKAPKRDTDGAVTTTITTRTLKKKLKLTTGQTAKVTVTCSTGTKKIVKSTKKLSLLLR